MKILHLIYDHMNNPWVGGGGAVRVYELSRRLMRMGNEVTVVSGNYPGAAPYAETGPFGGKLNYEFVGQANRGYAISTFSFAFAAARYVSKHSEQYDVVVEDFAPWNPAFARVFSRKPVILHINHREGVNIIKRRPLGGLPFFLIDKFYPSLYKNLTVLSEGTQAKVGRKDGVVLPAGIDEALLGRPERPRGDSSYSKGPVLYIGRLEIYNKGLDTLFDALKGLQGVKLQMAGRGRDEAALKAMAQERGIEVEFLGFVSEEQKIGLLESARCLVLASRFEGWGIVVLEAAACSTPCVVSDIEELSFALEGGFGVSFRTAEPASLREALTEALGHPERLGEMGAKGRDFVRAYTWQSIAEVYLRYLRRTVEGRAPR